MRGQELRDRAPAVRESPARQVPVRAGFRLGRLEGLLVEVRQADIEDLAIAMWDLIVPVILPFSIRLRVAVSMPVRLETWVRVRPLRLRSDWMLAPRCFIG